MEKHIEILVDHKEYITKEEAYNAINEQYHETGLDGYQDGIELMNRIAKIPAADVMEVRHGRWVSRWICSNMAGFEYACRCSECNKPTYRISTHEPMLLFCPRCGAKMDGGQDDV